MTLRFDKPRPNAVAGWQYQHSDGRISSPISAQQLSGMIESGELGIDTPVCHHVKTNGTWIKAISMATEGKRRNATKQLTFNEPIRRKAAAAIEARHVRTRSIDLPKDPSPLRILYRHVTGCLHRVRIPIVATSLLFLTVAILGAIMHFGGNYMADQSHASASEEMSADEKEEMSDSTNSTSEPEEELADSRHKQAAANERDEHVEWERISPPSTENFRKATTSLASSSQSTRTLSSSNSQGRDASERPQAKNGSNLDSSPELPVIAPPRTVQVRGRRLRHLMEKDDLLPAELANRTGIDQGKIDRVLRSTSTEVYLHIGERLAAEFGVDLTSL